MMKFILENSKSRPGNTNEGTSCPLFSPYPSLFPTVEQSCEDSGRSWSEAVSSMDHKGPGGSCTQCLVHCLPIGWASEMFVTQRVE